MKRPRIKPHVKPTPEYEHLLALVSFTAEERHAILDAARRVVAGGVYAVMCEKTLEYEEYRKKIKERRRKEARRARAYRKAHGTCKGFRHSARPKLPAATVNAWRLELRGNHALDQFFNRAMKARKKLMKIVKA